MPWGSLQKPSFSIAFIISSKTKKYFFALTFYKATWLAYRARWFKWVTAIRITLIVFKLTNLWLNALIKGQVYPWVRRWRLILLVHIYTTHYPYAEKLSLPLFSRWVTSFSASLQPKSLRTTNYRRAFIWCLMEKLRQKNRPFPDTLACCPL